MRRFLPYLKYLKNVRWPLIGAILCGVIYGVASGMGLPYMAKEVFPQIFSKDAPPLGSWQLLAVSLALPLVFVIRGITGYFNSYLTQYVGVRVLEALRLDYFRKLQQLPLAFFHRHSTGDLITRGLSDTNQLQNILTLISSELIKQPATLLAALGTLIALALTEKGVMLVLLSLAIIPLTVLPIHFVGKKIVKRAQQVAEHSGSIADRFTENLSAAREVRAFGMEDAEVRRFGNVSAAMIKMQMKVAKYALSLSPTIEVISAIGIAVTFVYSYRAHLPLESFLAIAFALFSCYEPVKKLGAMSSELKRGAASLDRIEGVLDAPLVIEDPVNPVTVTRLAGDIEFRDVSFAYKKDAVALRDVSVNIPRGTVCALVGTTGSGKSTFASLVPRFYDSTDGIVLIDGVAVRDMRIADLRRNVAIVSQDPVLFNDSIYSNILIGRPDASQAEVEQAARDAFAHDFIVMQPDGYQTIVGERGGQLSGGQRQRVAIARAFLRQAPILILDEATSALDSESEAFIQLALKKLMLGKTVLIIAHRFSTIRDASLILVLQGGRVIARGSHAGLYDSSALYKTLYDRQGQLAHANVAVANSIIGSEAQSDSGSSRP